MRKEKEKLVGSEKFIYDLIPTDRYISRGELITATGYSDTFIRREISEIKKVRTIISNSKQAGYRKAKQSEKLSKIVAKEEIENVNRCINEIRSKKKVYDKQLRQYIAYKKVLEAKVGTENK